MITDESGYTSGFETYPSPQPHVVGVPEGWKLVPIKPTIEMECAPDHDDTPTPDAAKAVYWAMLAAAPPSPLDIVTIPVIHSIQDSEVRAAIPPCPFCDSNDDVVTLRDRLRTAEEAVRMARPYVEDRLHRLDGEIEGSVASLLTFLDGAVTAPPPSSNLVADIPLLADLQRHVDEIGHTEVGENIRSAIEVIKHLAAQSTQTNVAGDRIAHVRSLLKNLEAKSTEENARVISEAEQLIYDLTPSPQTNVDVEAEIASVVQSVNEWDDRTSPDDYPDHLLITSEELADILRNFAETLGGRNDG